MRLRQTIKEPIKFTPPMLLEKKRGEKPRGRPRKEEHKKVLNLTEPDFNLLVVDTTPEAITPSPVKSTPEKYEFSSGSERTPTSGKTGKKRGRPPKNSPPTPTKALSELGSEGESPKVGGRNCCL